MPKSLLKDSTPDLYAFSSLEEALEFTNKNFQITVESSIIAGGVQIYKEAMDSKFATELLLTEIQKDYNCDLFFSEIPSEYVEKTGKDSEYAKSWEEKGTTLKLRHFVLSEN